MILFQAEWCAFSCLKQESFIDATSKNMQEFILGVYSQEDFFYYYYYFKNMLNTNSSWPQPAQIKGLVVIFLGEGVIFCSIALCFKRAQDDLLKILQICFSCAELWENLMGWKCTGEYRAEDWRMTSPLSVCF